MRSLEEIKEYLENDGICASDLLKLETERGVIFLNIRVKITDKTIEDFDKWYADGERGDVKKCPQEVCDDCDIHLDEFESHLAGLWITLHDIATEAIECPIDDELQVRSCVKAKSLVTALFDAYRDTTVAFDVEEE